MEHIESDILLTMPKIPELSDPAMTDEMLLKNKDIVEQMEQEVMLWEKHIQKANISISSILLCAILLQFSETIAVKNDMCLYLNIHFRDV